MAALAGVVTMTTSLAVAEAEARAESAWDRLLSELHRAGPVSMTGITMVEGCIAEYDVPDHEAFEVEGYPGHYRTSTFPEPVLARKLPLIEVPRAPEVVFSAHCSSPETAGHTFSNGRTIAAKGMSANASVTLQLITKYCLCDGTEFKAEAK